MKDIPTNDLKKLRSFIAMFSHPATSAQEVETSFKKFRERMTENGWCFDDLSAALEWGYRGSSNGDLEEDLERARQAARASLDEAWRQKENAERLQFELIQAKAELAVAKIQFEQAKLELAAEERRSAEMRARFMTELEQARYETARALRDLRETNRQANQPRRPREAKHETPTERREKIVSLLSNPATAMLSDREIARQVGCDSKTPGNVRRMLAKEKPRAKAA